jgi:hypothetical protein
VLAMVFQQQVELLLVVAQTGRDGSAWFHRCRDRPQTESQRGIGPRHGIRMHAHEG